MAEDRNALSWWFPKIEAAGLPVPRTIMLAMPEAAREEIIARMDGESTEAGSDALTMFANKIGIAAAVLGWPAFLRTDHTSAKHSWERSCYLTQVSNIGRHLYEIAEYSALADMIGMPWDRWAVREFLPTKPLGVCPRYRNMPVVREFRVFAEDGRIVCAHAYWPEEALAKGGADPGVYAQAAQCSGDEYAKVFELAERASAAVGGAWSVDVLDTERGWFITDMALAGDSFHMAGCSEAQRFARSKP